MNKKALADFQHIYNPLHYYCKLKDIEKLSDENIDFIVKDFQIHYDMVTDFLKGKFKKDVLINLIDKRRRLEYNL